MSTPANLSADAFAGAAAAYARYRPPYPRALLDALVERAAIGPRAGLLDLACGPGRVALDLAAAFETVWAVDLEPEMIAVGRAEAARRGVGHVDWRVGRAEDLAAPDGGFDLITIGEAFHRLDQAVVAGRALAWLKPGGCLATLGAMSLLDGREAWQVATAQVAHRWMARAFPQGWAAALPGAQTGPDAYERVLRAAGFVEVESVSYDEPHAWTCEAIIGYLQSTSVCSKKALGGDFAAFEAELRAALGEPAATTTFHETMRWGYTLGRKPR